MKELSIVIPTFNERDNIIPLLEGLAAALEGIQYEVIFVDDDSPDGTADLLREIAQRNGSVRLIHRINRRGLASACLEGMLASSAPYMCVMDADLQHDERILPEMLRKLKADHLDVVVGSRNIEGGSMGDFARERVALSMLGKRISNYICRCNIQDPMSGFFMLTRSMLLEVVHDVSSIGFKILVDLLASSPRPLRVAEVPYSFRQRQHGKSKLDLLVTLEYLQLVVDKSIGRYVPASFILFSLVGSIGVVLHALTLWIALSFLGFRFGQSQVIAATVAMTANFLLNNLVTYRDRRLRGWRLIRGLALFYAACSIGLLVNLKIAEMSLHAGVHWLIAGLLGLMVGSVWNYAVTSVLTWNTYRKARYRPATRARPSSSSLS